MKRTFEYNDDKSNKFWTIETDDCEMTVTFGKIGTDGQSKTKEFDDEDECKAEAAKLIREKMKKGYVEKDDLMSYDEANDFEVDENESPGTGYYNLTNEKLVPFITTGVTHAIRKFRELTESGKIEDYNISVELDRIMKFYLGEDECEGEPFFEFDLGPLLDVSMELQEKMEAASGTPYSQAVSNLFEDASVDESEYEGLNIALWVPIVGGDPYIENFID